MDTARFLSCCASLGLSLSQAQLAEFESFEEDLYKTNEVMNLTRVPREECWRRHFIDSLLIAELIPEGAAVLDIGTGPGFPAWPLACARPDLQATALDSSNKMLGFLKKHPLPNLKIVNDRAETSGIRERFDVVTGRAVAPLPIFIELAVAPAKIKGLVIPMRSINDATEIAEKDFSKLGLKLEKSVERALPMQDAEEEVNRLFPVYRKVKKTPSEYPRAWAEIKRRTF